MKKRDRVSRNKAATESRRNEMPKQVRSSTGYIDTLMSLKESIDTINSHTAYVSDVILAAQHTSNLIAQAGLAQIDTSFMAPNVSADIINSQATSVSDVILNAERSINNVTTVHAGLSTQIDNTFAALKGAVDVINSHVLYVSDAVRNAGHIVNCVVQENILPQINTGSIVLNNSLDYIDAQVTRISDTILSAGCTINTGMQGEDLSQINAASMRINSHAAYLSDTVLNIKSAINCICVVQESTIPQINTPSIAFNESLDLINTQAARTADMIAYAECAINRTPQENLFAHINTASVTLQESMGIFTQPIRMPDILLGTGGVICVPQQEGLLTQINAASVALNESLSFINTQASRMSDVVLATSREINFFDQKGLLTSGKPSLAFDDSINFRHSHNTYLSEEKSIVVRSGGVDLTASKIEIDGNVVGRDYNVNIQIQANTVNIYLYPKD